MKVLDYHSFVNRYYNKIGILRSFKNRFGCYTDQQLEIFILLCKHPNELQEELYNYYIAYMFLNNYC